jgi:AcrR family transcriptional regulator
MSSAAGAGWPYTLSMESKRKYELKERAVRQAATRQRIVDATVSLHREVGPARTTISEVARRAGVGRVTVYNHFPDDESLLAATSEQFADENPPPDPADWKSVKDPDARLKSALGELYGYYRENQAMLANVGRDAAIVPALAAVRERSGAAAREEAMADALMAGRKLRGKHERRTRAAIALALAFPTWQRLTAEGGLKDGEAAKLMARAVDAA